MSGPFLVELSCLARIRIVSVAKSYVRVWLFAALFLGGAYHASAAIIEETHALEAALEDGFYPLVESSIKELLAREIPSEEAAHLRSLLAHAFYGQEKYDELSELASRHGSDDRFVYWLACAYRGLYAYEQALSVLEGDQSEGLWAAKRLLLKSDLLYRVGRLEEAEGVALRCQSVFHDPADRDQNIYQLAMIVRDQQRFEEAENLLNSLIERGQGNYMERAELVLADLYLRWDERARSGRTTLAKDDQPRG